MLIGHTPCNNWVNHSFYQINPEMVYSFAEATLGDEALHCALQPNRPAHACKGATTTNPNITGKRRRLSGSLTEEGSSSTMRYASRCVPQNRRTGSINRIMSTDGRYRTRMARKMRPDGQKRFGLRRP